MIESFVLPQRVEFDIKNPAHRQAACLLLLYGRQHPSIRFRFKPTEYGSVREYLTQQLLFSAFTEAERRAAEQEVNKAADAKVGTIFDGPLAVVKLLPIRSKK